MIAEKIKNAMEEIDRLTAERDELKKVIDAQIECDNEMMADRDYWKRLAKAALDIVNDESLTIQAWHLEKFQRLKSVEEGGK